MGVGEWDSDEKPLLDERGNPTQHAPPWLRLVHQDATQILPQWTGFREEWRDTLEHDCSEEVLETYWKTAQPTIDFPSTSG